MAGGDAHQDGLYGLEVIGAEVRGVDDLVHVIEVVGVERAAVLQPRHGAHGRTLDPARDVDVPRVQERSRVRLQGYYERWRS